MSVAATHERDTRFDRALAAVESVMPKAGEWAFAFRIWTAMVVALYAAFWLQLSSATSAIVCVGILAQPKRGQALAKALYRVVGTVVGGIVAILFVALFAQDRTELLLAYAVWLALCVFVAQYLQDVRAYGAMLSGYTVSIIALSNIDQPQMAFDAAVNRLAAITLAIVVVTFINDALASPSTWTGVRKQLAEALQATQLFAATALSSGDPGPARAAALLGQIGAMRPDANAIAGELDDGRQRAAGARSGIAALYEMVATSRALADASAAADATGPRVREALGIARAVAAEAPEEAGALEGEAARLAELVDEAMLSPDATLAEILVLQRALDLVEATRFARDGLAALSRGQRPLREVRLPTHRDFQVAILAAVRVAVAYGVTAAILVATGLPAASFALVQVSATAALSSVTPDPKAFAKGVLIGMPLAALAAGIVLFGLLPGTQGFLILAIAIAPVIVVGSVLSLRPATGTVGFILIVFFPVLLSPANPQSYDIQTFLTNTYLVILSAVILAASVRIILPLTPAQQRVFALRSARRDIVDALSGEGGDVSARISLDADRLQQFAKWGTGSGTVGRSVLGHAFSLARLEVAAARAHEELSGLRPIRSLAGIVQSARDALVAADAGALRSAAANVLRAAGGEPPTCRAAMARTASDLAAAATILESDRKLLHRLRVTGVRL